MIRNILKVKIVIAIITTIFLVSLIIIKINERDDGEVMLAFSLQPQNLQVTRNIEELKIIVLNDSRKSGIAFLRFKGEALIVKKESLIAMADSSKVLQSLFGLDHQTLTDQRIKFTKACFIYKYPSGQACVISDDMKSVVFRILRESEPF